MRLIMRSFVQLIDIGYSSTLYQPVHRGSSLQHAPRGSHLLKVLSEVVFIGFCQKLVNASLAHELELRMELGQSIGTISAVVQAQVKAASVMKLHLRSARLEAWKQFHVLQNIRSIVM